MTLAAEVKAGDACPTCGRIVEKFPPAPTANEPRRRLKNCAAATLDIFLGQCHEQGKPLLEGMEHALDILEQSQLPEIPPAIGVGRMADNCKSVLISFARPLTDDELRELHEHLAQRE